MIAWALTWLSKAKLKLWAILTTLLFLLVFMWRMVRLGSKAAKAEVLERSIQNIKVADDVEKSIDKLPDADIDQRMREQGYYRD